MSRLRIGPFRGYLPGKEMRGSIFSRRRAACNDSQQTHLAKLIPEGEVAVSRTVKDLVAGSGLGFDDIGLKKFDGVEGEWRLFSVK